MITTTASAALLRDADLCVKCGLCLPHCPTYALSGHEADGPRGRIALMQGLWSGTTATASLQSHLDGCLACRACESVCPAHVPYGRLIAGARTTLAATRPRRVLFTRVLAALVTHPPWRTITRTVLWVYQRLGLQRAVAALLAGTRLGRLNALLPTLRLQAPPRGIHTAPGARGQADLFTGCLGHWVDQPALNDAVTLMNAAGWSVRVPGAQRCCGALHLHAGLERDAARLAAANVAAFASGDGPIVSCASGCGATLREYPVAFGDRVRDVAALLLDADWSSAGFTPLAATVAIHTPCTARLAGTGATAALLRLIPGIKPVELDPDGRCCGAAGSYFVTEPQAADLLVATLVERIAALRPDYVVSANTGCAMHLTAALRRAGIAAEVIHPVSLLARQFPRPGSARLPAAAAAAPPARPA